MVWKALEALGMLSEALGSFDVNTVCPLPGSWINHVESRLWECRVFVAFADKAVMFQCIFQKCTHVTKVSCFSDHVPFVLAP